MGTDKSRKAQLQTMRKEGRLPAMEVRDLSFAYGKNPVLKGISLYIEEGLITTIMGANGCGKSTLFALMTRNLTPDKGKIFLRGKNIQELSLKDYARRVAIVNQYNTASGDIRVEQLVSYGRTPFHKMMEENNEEDDRLIQWAMEVTGITAYRDREIGRLSGGQRQRVWIAMALAQNTRILFLDEPTTYLDIRYQIEILELVRELNRKYGLTIVMVLHDINQAIYYSDRIIGLADGKVSLKGIPREVIGQDSIEDLYGVRLRVCDVDGERVVLPAGREKDETDMEGASMDPVKMKSSGGKLPESGRGYTPDEGKKGAAALMSSDPDGGSADTVDDEDEKENQEAGAGTEMKLSRFRAVRAVWIVLGLIALGFGIVGIVLPILPTVPFMLAAFFCFARGSERLYRWFIGTGFYHNYLETYADHKAMTMKAKVRIVGTVTAVMALGFFMMKRVPVGRIVLAVVWAVHVIVFFFVIKTEPAGRETDDAQTGQDPGRAAGTMPGEQSGSAAVRQAGKDLQTQGGAQAPAGRKKKENPMIKTRLIKLLDKSKKYVYLQVLWQWLSLLCQVVLIFTAVNLMDAARTGNLTRDLITKSLLPIIAAILLRVFFDRRAAAASFAASVDVKRVLREKIYGKILRLGAAYREQVPTSEVMQLAGEGVEQLETYFGKYLSQFFYSLIAPLTLFLILMRVSLKASLVLLICVPLIPGVIMMIQKIAKRLLSKYWDIYAGLGDSFLENLQGLTTLKIYQADQKAADDMDVEAEHFRRITMKVLQMQLNSIIIMDVIAYGGAAIGMIIAIGEVMAGRLDFAGAMKITLLAAEFFIPMRLLGSFFHIAMNGMAASDRMFALLDLPEPREGSQEMAAGPVGISLKDVSFSYEEERPILEGLNLELPAGKLVSLVGVSGSGKSTVAGILMGRNQGYKGQILAGGADLSQLREASHMQRFTLVCSSCHLFRGTVEENLRMGSPQVTSVQMWEALRKVNLEAFLRAQEGLDTHIAESGKNLSGGQCQRLALARALLHDSDVYIFDEATSNIDMESEEQIMQVVHDLAKEKTVLLISHRLANVVSSDRIYMLTRGRITEEGTHEELMKLGGAYAALYSQQKELEEYGRREAV